MNPFAQLVSMLFDIYVSVILMRFFLQYFRADYYNPLSQFIIKITDPLVKPLRRIIPGLGGIDLSTLLLAWLVTVAKFLLIFLLSGGGALSNPVGFILLTLVEVLSATIGLYIFLIIIRIIISWIATGNYNPVFLVITQLTEPPLAKIRRLLPPMSGFDFSPMLLLILLFFINSSISYYLHPLLL
ncbi:YggT family protein [Aliikangiella sp. IMCC44359]|uniref:YggT family protein n=1 Tax=Aliikangiella sp. IMCC44359 TaxID=3459125 RepID=UPI00403B0018